MKKEVNIDEMVNLFREIERAFPHLKMILDVNHPHVDINMDIPKQTGLVFDINLNLQGDELHLSAGAFWLEWFPCRKQDIVQAYREAVKGLLTGQFRIVEYYRGKRAVKADLQRPCGSSWETIGTWSTLSFPYPWQKTTKLLRNI